MAHRYSGALQGRFQLPFVQPRDKGHASSAAMEYSEEAGFLAAATRVPPGGALPQLAGSVHPSSTTVTPLNMNGLSLTRNGIPLAVVTFSRMTSLVLTYGNLST